MESLKLTKAARGQMFATNAVPNHGDFYGILLVCSGPIMETATLDTQVTIGTIGTAINNNAGTSVLWQGNLSASGNYGGSATTGYLSIPDTVLTAATKSGVATWFVAAFSWKGNNLGCVTGTVSTSGSGGDLQIGNTDIVAGTQYKTNGFQITLPSEYTF